MPATDVVGHALLSGKVTAWSPDVLEAEQDLAEALLGVTADLLTDLDETDLTRVVLAVVLQMNLQAATDMTHFILESMTSTQQGESRKYRDVSVHPRAQMLIDLVFGSGASAATLAAWRNTGVTRSARTEGGVDSPVPNVGWPA